MILPLSEYAKQLFEGLIEFMRRRIESHSTLIMSGHDFAGIHPNNGAIHHETFATHIDLKGGPGRAEGGYDLNAPPGKIYQGDRSSLQMDRQSIGGIEFPTF